MDERTFTKPGAVEYCMPKEMAEELIKMSGKSKKHLKIQLNIIK